MECTCKYALSYTDLLVGFETLAVGGEVPSLHVFMESVQLCTWSLLSSLRSYQTRNLCGNTLTIESRLGT